MAGTDPCNPISGQRDQLTEVNPVPHSGEETRAQPSCSHSQPMRRQTSGVTRTRDLDEWLDRVKISPPVVVALTFVMDRSGRVFVTHAIRLLMKMLSKVTNENELKMSAISFIDKGARLSKLVEGAARNPEEKSIMQLLCTFECAIRIDELWDTLKDHYTGQNSMINKEITVKGLRDKIANTSPTHLGSLNSNTTLHMKVHVTKSGRGRTSRRLPVESGKNGHLK